MHPYHHLFDVGIQIDLVVDLWIENNVLCVHRFRCKNNGNVFTKTPPIEMLGIGVYKNQLSKIVAKKQAPCDISTTPAADAARYRTSS